MFQSGYLSPIEMDVKELLEDRGYKVYNVKSKPGNSKRVVNADILAIRDDESRYVKIIKARGIPHSPETIERRFRQQVCLARKFLASHLKDPGIHCELWFYSTRTGYHAYEVLKDHVEQLMVQKQAGISKGVSRAIGSIRAALAAILREKEMVKIVMYRMLLLAIKIPRLVSGNRKG